MKKLLLIATVILAMAAASCNQEMIVPGTKTLIVHAGDPATKTAIIADGGGYKSTWKAGDKIMVMEVTNFDSDAVQTALIESSPLTADATTASFSVSLPSNTGPFKYVVVYPSTTPSPSGPLCMDYNTTDGTTFLAGIVTTQRPTADSFDPEADLLVSDMISTSTQPSSLDVKFARVGSIARVTLKGLPSGATITSGRMTFPDLWSPYAFRFSPTKKSLVVANELIKGAQEIIFEPDGVVADASGEAVIWLRTASGTLDDWFGFEVKVNDSVDYCKLVDLSDAGKTLSFTQGNLTSFSVTLAAGTLPPAI